MKKSRLSICKNMESLTDMIHEKKLQSWGSMVTFTQIHQMTVPRMARTAWLIS